MLEIYFFIAGLCLQRVQFVLINGLFNPVHQMNEYLKGQYTNFKTTEQFANIFFCFNMKFYVKIFFLIIFMEYVHQVFFCSHTGNYSQALNMDNTFLAVFTNTIQSKALPKREICLHILVSNFQCLIFDFFSFK